MELFKNQFVRVIARVIDNKFQIETYERASNYCYGKGVQEALRWASPAEKGRLMGFTFMYEVHE